MESNAKPGRIQCSDTSAKLLREQDPTILLKKRRPISVKGKGIMQTYWVNEGLPYQLDGYSSVASSTVTPKQEVKKDNSKRRFDYLLEPLCEEAHEDTS